MSIDRSAARLWSLDRIREEIANLRSMIQENERDISELTNRYSSSIGLRSHASPGHIGGMEDKIIEWENDIKFLTSLL